MSPADHLKTNHADFNTNKRKNVEKIEKRHSTIRKIVRTNGKIKVNVLDIDSYLESFK